MKKNFIKTLLFIFVFVISINSVFFVVNAEETNSKYYLGEVVNAEKDSGYSKSNKIEENDPHFGWSLGSFFVNGYSAVEKDDNKNPVFLKNVGDKITLWFCLEQNLEKLNNNESLTINEDKNGYDEYFGIEKTNFGKGTLIVRQKNHENQWQKPVIYKDFLDAKTKKDAYTQVELFEEGDYEVALNYEIKKENIDVFGWSPFPSFYNYRIFFSFSVRNGNCMVYPFDVKTGEELTNSAFTENGFYIDLANSKYLSTNVKKENLKKSGESLVEDVRFNRPAKDKEQYTDEGVYTITVKNKYTKQETIKKIYVGTNDVLKAYVTTGFSVKEINRQLALGASIDNEGKLVLVSSKQETEKEQKATSTKKFVFPAICTLVLLVILVVLVIVIKKKKLKLKNKDDLSNNFSEELQEELDEEVEEVEEETKE